MCDHTVHVCVITLRADSWQAILPGTKSKNGIVTTGITNLEANTLPVVAIQSSFPLLTLGQMSQQ